MESRIAPLPEFASPPLVEVVCGVQFSGLEGFTSVHFGRFGDKLGSEYSDTEDRSPISEMTDSASREPTAEVLQVPPLRRVFYITQSGDFLYQLQSNRFLSNWRKLEHRQSYPRFGAAFQRFSEGWEKLTAFAQTSSLTEPTPTFCELTYINHIPESHQPFPAGFEHYLPSFRVQSGTTGSYLGAPIAGAFTLSFPLPAGSGQLVVTAKHGQRQPDKKNILVLELTVNGRAPVGDFRAWFAEAHEAVVRGFTDLTSEKAHLEWERTR